MGDNVGLHRFYEEKHRAPKIANGEMPPPLRPRSHPPMRYDDRFTPYLRQAGLLPFCTLCQRGIPSFNHALSALVDRWRPETHSFHLPSGEMTVALQDVGLLFALPIRGHPVCGSTASAGWRQMVHELLGAAPEPPSPPAKESKTSGVPLKWLEENFQNLAQNANNDEVRKHCRAYVLHLFGAVLFPDSAGDVASWMFLPLLRDFNEAGTYSWGSAALGWLYRQLCYACQRTRPSSCLAGSVYLLQLWMWLRLPVGRPAWVRQREWASNDPDRKPTAAYLYDTSASGVGRREALYLAYTNEIDSLQPCHVVWEPYATEAMNTFDLNPSCTRDQDLWLTRCPLICFFVVEYHLPERVMRQFGRFQASPPPYFSTSIDLHKMDRQKCKKITDWSHEHRRYIEEWEQLEENNMWTESEHDSAQFNRYLQWFHSNYRVHLRPRWTSADILDEDFDEVGDSTFDQATRAGTTVEPAPVAHRIAWELHKTINEAGMALATPLGSETSETVLRVFVDGLRTRCRKMAARLGCRASLQEVVEPASLTMGTQSCSHSILGAAGSTSHEPATDFGVPDVDFSFFNDDYFSDHVVQHGVTQHAEGEQDAPGHEHGEGEQDPPGDEHEEIGATQLPDAHVLTGGSAEPDVPGHEHDEIGATVMANAEGDCLQPGQRTHKAPEKYTPGSNALRRRKKN